MRVSINYRNYKSFRNQDPVVDAMRTVIKTDLKMKNSMAHQITGVATATFDNWFDGTTANPRNATTCQAMAGLGYVRRDRMLKDGSVEPGFVKARELDWQEEIEKQTEFFLETHPTSKSRRRKRKKNGHAPARKNGHVRSSK